VFGTLPAGILDLACAIEFLHTYSLIHDDLPALDNDDLRRGRPTCHKKFGEATAILAGDALLTLAFETTSNLKNITARKQNEILRELARAGGTRGGMLAGQVADLEAESRRISPRQLEAIHRGKTGALIRASLRTGALYAGASKAALNRLSRFGDNLGLAFQIVDDILDVRSSTANLGKTARKDAAHGKATYPGVHGLAKSEQMAAKLVDQACAQLKPLGARAEPLQQIARYLLTRTK
jgi:geranylgeranyl diphosphate synthase type II